MQAARCRSASPFSKGLRLHPLIAPFNFGPAVKLSGTEADGVGVWKLKGSTVVIDWIMGTRRRTPGPTGCVRDQPERSGEPAIALLSAKRAAMANLLVRGVDDDIVQALKQRAGAHGRSAEAEHRAILAAALLTPSRRNLAELLRAMPHVGLDTDFGRTADHAEATDVFD